MMNYSNCPKTQTGFSVIELITVLIIIGILIGATYPSYLDAVTKGRRAEARSALYAVLLKQERYYTQHNTYFAFDSETPNSPFNWWSGDTASSSYYEIHASNCPHKSLSQCVLLTAIPGTDKVKTNSDPVCGNLMLDSANNKSYSVSTEPNSSCW